MIKILGICGSPRRKSCYQALQTALKAAEGVGDEIEIELVELRTRKMNFCIHCNKCLRDHSDRCTVFKDDMTELYKKVYEADGILIASPVYEMNITAQLCTFFDRFRSAWLKGVEEPDFFSRKVGAGITVGGTRNGGQEAAMNAITNFFLTQGMTVCTGGSGMYSGPMLWNPGDGSTEIDDPEGFKNCEILGVKIAKMAGIMKKASF